jgi:hypothetical protein
MKGNDFTPKSPQWKESALADETAALLRMTCVFRAWTESADLPAHTPLCRTQIDWTEVGENR